MDFEILMPTGRLGGALPFHMAYHLTWPPCLVQKLLADALLSDFPIAAFVDSRHAIATSRVSVLAILGI